MYNLYISGMSNKEFVRLYLTEELRDSTRGVFSLAQTSKDLGMEPDDLKLALKQLVLEKVLSIFEQQSNDELFIEFQI